MGALTLKSFPFELRGWDIEKFESIDPTDGFGTSTRIYISKQQVIQIEPDHSENTTNAWLSDKGRQFFDGIFSTFHKKNSTFVLKKNTWNKNIKKILQTIYLFEHCNAKMKKNYFLTFVVENLGLETLSLLKIIEHNYSFIKIRRAENLNFQNDLETDFQLNDITNLTKLNTTTFCLLIANNPRYEGYNLNLKLRQRFLKGNFKCVVLGSLKSLTFPTFNIGTNLNILKTIAEGNEFICQEFRTAKYPLLIFNSELFKRTDALTSIKILKNYNNFTILSQNWNGMNYLHSNLSEVGAQTITKLKPLQKKDFNQFSSIYFINVMTQNIPNLKKLAETKLLHVNPLTHSSATRLFLDQNSQITSNQMYMQNFTTFNTNKNYTFLPVKMFYENQETFINTEGFIKKTTKLITNKKTREGWKLIRNLLKNFNNHTIILTTKNNNFLSFNSTNTQNFRNFIDLHYKTTNKLDNTTSFSVNKNKPFFITKNINKFKQNILKIKNTKLKYWLDDFFLGGKDEYSKNSTTLALCSKTLRIQSTNFF